jgi:hypothetical protein
MIGALILGLLAGIIGRALMPGDILRSMSGPLIVLLIAGFVARRTGTTPRPAGERL